MANRLVTILKVAAIVGLSALPLSAAPKKCGSERWDVKTLNDSDASSVSTTVVHTTIADLNKLPSRCGDIPDERDSDVESTVYEVVGRITFAAHENDRDVHLGIQDLKKPSKTMIVEIVDPTCPGAKSSSFKPTFATVRDNFMDDLLGDGSYDDLVGLTVRVRGVAFYDRNHGQNGRAKNCLELHPVLFIKETP